METPDTLTIVVREETAADVAQTDRIERDAFGQPDEARIVGALRDAKAITLSLVAEIDRQVVGHIVFSPVEIESETATITAVGLAPVAVDPAFQNKGIGGRLIREGLAQLQRRGHTAVVVLGHADYYPRFGFDKAIDHGLRWEHPCPPDAFMVRELRPGTLPPNGGVVRYRAEFG